MGGQPTRKLAVQLHADVVGSTALVRLNETLAHQRIQEDFSIAGYTQRAGSAYRYEEDVKRLVEGLRLAGAPE